MKRKIYKLPKEKIGFKIKEGYIKDIGTTYVVPEQKARREFGAHLTSVDIFKKFIFPHIRNVLYKYTWVDLFAGEGNLILPILEAIPKDERIDFFKNHIFPADNLEYGLVDKPVEIYSDYPVNVSTYHTAGLQSIVSSGKTYNLSMINKQIQVSPGIIRMQKGDVVIDSPANIALSEEYHFDVEEWYNIAENLNTNYTYITLSDVGNKELYYYLDLKKLPVDAKRIKILLDSRENLKEIKLVFLRKEE